MGRLICSEDNASPFLGILCRIIGMSYHISIEVSFISFLAYLYVENYEEVLEKISASGLRMGFPTLTLFSKL